MRHDPGPDDRLAEDILRGRVSAVPDEYHSLAQVMASIRSSADTAAPEPSAALRQVFAEGIRREEEQTDTAPAAAARPRSWRRVLGRAAGLGLAAKLALAGATAAAMAAGAGATGSLPGQDGPPSFLPWQVEAPADESDPGREIADEADGAGEGAGDEGSTVVERTDDLPGDGYRRSPADETESGERDQRDEDAAEVDEDARELRDEAGDPGPREAPADPPEAEADAERSDDPSSDADRPDDQPASDDRASSSTADEPSGGTDAAGTPDEEDPPPSPRDSGEGPQ